MYTAALRNGGILRPSPDKRGIAPAHQDFLDLFFNQFTAAHRALIKEFHGFLRSFQSIHRLGSGRYTVIRTDAFVSTVVIVSNTSPLMNLAVIRRLDLIERLYGSVNIPEAVADELAAALPEQFSEQAIKHLMAA